MLYFSEFIRTEINQLPLIADTAECKYRPELNLTRRQIKQKAFRYNDIYEYVRGGDVHEMTNRK